jgi:cysteine-rich repeat protein
VVTDPGDPTGDPSGDPTDGGDTETGGEPPGLVCDGFEAAALQWTLPDLGASEEVLDDLFHDSSVGCGDLDESLTFSRLDLTGDGKLDLVVTDLCDAAGVGTTEWRVYPATNTGYAAKAMSWSLPDLGTSEEVLDDLFHDSSVGCGALDESLTFSLLDLTGDGAADLVITDLCDAGGVGTTEWRVYPATGTGFAAKPSAWSLPDLGTSDRGARRPVPRLDRRLRRPRRVAGVLVARPDERRGPPDLVVTDLCDTAGVGTTQWRVYAATGTGFAAKPSAWSLPDLGTSGEVLDHMTHNSSEGCAGLEQTVSFSRLDLTRDGRPDLVVTNLCDAAGVGTTEWRVYAATDTGFAAKPTSWSLPDLGTSDEVLDDMAHDSSEGLRRPRRVADVHAARPDGRRRARPGGHRPVRRGRGSARPSGGSTRRRRPASRPSRSPGRCPTSGTSDEVLDDMFHDSSEGCGGLDESLTFTRLDLTGDGEPDLVVTDLCDTAGVGTTEWRVYPATPTGFAAKPMSWPLPDLGASEEVLSTTCFHDSSVGCGALDETRHPMVCGDTTWTTTRSATTATRTTPTDLHRACKNAICGDTSCRLASRSATTATRRTPTPAPTPVRTPSAATASSAPARCATTATRTTPTPAPTPAPPPPAATPSSRPTSRSATTATTTTPTPASRTCKAASCGDMAIQADVEECDDGNMVDTDACTAMCKTAKCGDMIVRPASRSATTATWSTPTCASTPARPPSAATANAGRRRGVRRRQHGRDRHVHQHLQGRQVRRRQGADERRAVRRRQHGRQRRLQQHLQAGSRRPSRRCSP